LNDVELQIAMLEKNLAAFKKRFPALGENLSTQALSFTEKAHKRTGNGQDSPLIPLENGSVFEAKNGEITASYKELLVHSRYNPSGEAEKLLNTDSVREAESVVFCGAGLGYAPQAAAKMYASKNLILIEPDPLCLLHAFSLFDWTRILQVPSCIFLLQADLQTVLAVLEHYGLQSAAIIAPKAATERSRDYFSALQELIIRNKNKQYINERTSEKFGALWISNICKNLVPSSQLNGIDRYKNGAPDIPFCILAAGPSLEDTLPFLAEIKKRAVLICTDTALRSCLHAGVEPHFILLADPQYWNARHITDLRSPSSILITESAAYPSVFRFTCREILLCASAFPLGRYIERFTEKKETLATGGSVASWAWDFARFCGAKTVYTAGLDLSYPANKTHARGSTFEENVHFNATRLCGSESRNTDSVYGNPAYRTGKNAFDYEGNPVITDERMRLYAWWFESKCASFPSVRTFSLSAKSVRIPGIEPADVEALLNLEARESLIETFCFGDKNGAHAYSPSMADDGKSEQKADGNPGGRNSRDSAADNLHKALVALSADLRALNTLTEKALELCRAAKDKDDCGQLLHTLCDIDKHMEENSAATLVSLLCPAAFQPKVRLPARMLFSPESERGIQTAANIQKTVEMYEAVHNSIKAHIDRLKKNNLFI